MQIEIHQNIFLRSHRIPDPRGHIWLIHPFGESGLCYKEAFASILTEGYNLFVPDLPGFGVSPNQGRPRTMEALASDLMALMEELSAGANIFLVAHSVSGLIGTLICQAYREKIKGYVSVEGNLLEVDSYYSSLALHHSKEEFYKKYTDAVFVQAATRIDFRRYLSSIYFADVDAMVTWSKSTAKYISGKQAAQAFMELPCPKLYIWGDKDSPAETQAFIRNNQLPNQLFAGIGHWPMLEVPDRFYKTLDDFFKTVLESAED